MSLTGALSLSQSGLAHINRQLQVVSSNIANAETPGYTRKSREAQNIVAGSDTVGLRTGELQRRSDLALQTQLWRSIGTSAGLEATQDILRRVDIAHGRPEDGTSIGGLIGRVQQSFISLSGAPSDSALQSNIVIAADELAKRFNSVADAITASRQQAQDQIISEISGLNQDLQDVFRLTEQINIQAARGIPSPDIEDQRDLVLTRIAERVDIRIGKTDQGDLFLTTPSGQPLPVTGQSLLNAYNATVAAQAYYGPPAGTIPPITLGGQDITPRLTGGRIGALLTLRDQTLPRMQAELDEVAQKTALRFEEQGLRLFTDPSGTVPVSLGNPAVQDGYIGFSQAIQVNPAVAAAPRLVRDGTHAIAGVPGGPTAFTPNPAGGPASFGTLIERIVAHALGSTVSPGNPHTATFAAGALGPSGNLASPFIPPQGLGDYASTVVSMHASDRAAAGSRLKDETALRDLLRSRYQDRVGVDIDEEMATLVTLQTAYAANARVISVVQTVWDATLAMVR